MDYENGEWIIHGLNKSDCNRIKTVDELVKYINKTGFLPLFKNEIEGFSLEEKTAACDWFCENPKTDPWIWREIIAREGRVAYGKFFNKRAGFVSLDWFSHLVNWRRDGYDFDSLSEEGKAPYRWELIMKPFEENNQMYSCELKRQAGFSKGGEKNFNGIVTDLQMQTYLVLCDFRQRLNKKGQPYGMQIAILATPESIWGYDAVTKAYTEDPEKSRELILAHLKKLLPHAEEKQIVNLCIK